VLIERAMGRAEGNVSQAAKLLGLSRATLDYRLKNAVRCHSGAPVSHHLMNSSLII